MAKKNFSAMNTRRAETAESSAVMRKLEQGASNKGQQGEATKQEAAERAAALRTQGRKGCKAIRINMAFTPDNHEFIKIMAKATGRTMTEYTNYIITAYRNEHPEFMEQADSFLKLVNAKTWKDKSEQDTTGQQEGAKDDKEN